MQLLLVGISHRTAPVELRERRRFPGARARRALRGAGRARLDPRGGGAVDVQSRRALRGVRRCRGDARGSGELRRRVQRRRWPATSRRTSTTSPISTSRGISSGWPPASNRWSSASRRFSGRSSRRTPSPRRAEVGPVLNRLFHSSFAVGKRVRTETSLGAGAVSIGYAAVALARKIFGDLGGRNVAGHRRRRDGQADRAAHEVAGRAAGDDRQPHDGPRGHTFIF